MLSPRLTRYIPRHSFSSVVPTGRHDALRSLYWRSRPILPAGRPSHGQGLRHCPPQGSEGSGGVWLLPIPRPVPSGMDGTDTMAGSPQRTVPDHRLPLCATRSGEADGRATLLQSEPWNGSSMTTLLHFGRRVVTGTGGAGKASARCCATKPGRIRRLREPARRRRIEASDRNP